MAAVQNQLIELLPRADRRRLLAACEPFSLVLGEVLNERGVTILDRKGLEAIACECYADACKTYTDLMR